MSYGFARHDANARFLASSVRGARFPAVEETAPGQSRIASVTTDAKLPLKFLPAILANLALLTVKRQVPITTHLHSERSLS